MPYIGYEPAKKPLTSADITDGVITSASISDGTIANADIANSTINLTTKVTGTLPVANGGTGLTALGTASQVLRTNSGATALEFATVSSDYVLLATSTASASSSISFDGYFSSTYSNYIVFINNMRPATDGAEPYIRFRRSNADITASDYKFVCPRARISSSGGNAVEAGDVSWGSSRISINQDMDNSVFWSLHGTVQLYNPLDTASYPSCIFDTNATETTAAEFYRRFGTGRLASTGALSGITFYFSSGNITSGTFKLYGLK